MSPFWILLNSVFCVLIDLLSRTNSTRAPGVHKKHRCLPFSLRRRLTTRNPLHGVLLHVCLPTTKYENLRRCISRCNFRLINFINSGGCHLRISWHHSFCALMLKRGHGEVCRQGRSTEPFLLHRISSLSFMSLRDRCLRAGSMIIIMPFVVRCLMTDSINFRGIVLSLHISASELVKRITSYCAVFVLKKAKRDILPV
jgi:hypothetical protein